MGMQTDIMTIQFGEIAPDTLQERKFVLPCVMPSDTKISMIILDKMGRTHWEKKVDIPEGHSSLELDLSKLEPGTYNAWIEAGGKTYIRSIAIESGKTHRVLDR